MPCAVASDGASTMIVMMAVRIMIIPSTGSYLPQSPMCHLVAVALSAWASRDRASLRFQSPTGIVLAFLVESGKDETTKFAE